MRVDLHAHYWPIEFAEAFERFGDGEQLVRQRKWHPSSLEQRIEELDAAGIGMQVLSSTPYNPYFPSAVNAAGAARWANDFYRDVVDKHAGRFAALGCLPFPHVDAVLDEAVRCLEEHMFAGFSVGCSIGERSLDDPLFEPIWQELDRRNVLVYVHPGRATRYGIGLESDFSLKTHIGGTTETATAALRLVTSGLVTRYPGIRFVVCQLGGVLSFLLRRVEANYQGGVERGDPWPYRGSLLEALRCMYYDTANCQDDPLTMLVAVKALGADRMVLGTDYPTRDMRQTIEAIEASPHLSDSERFSVLDLNARALLASTLRQ